MKRQLGIFVSTILMVCLLIGCGSSGSGQEAQSETKAPKTNYTEHQTEMGNYMNYGYAYIANGWVYTIGWGANTSKPLFLKMRTDGSDDSVIRYYESADYITVNGEYIYAAMTGDSQNIYRYRLGGEDETLLVSDATDMQIKDKSIYYCKTDGNKNIKYCKSDINGKNEEVVLDKEIYVPYQVDGALFYQDDADNETIHRYDLTTKEDIQITKEKSYAYILNDDYMYCVLNDGSTKDDDYEGYLAKIDLETLEAETIYDGVYTGALNIKDDRIFFINTNDEYRMYSIDKKGENISLVTQDSYCWGPCIYDDKIIYCDAADNYEYVDDIFICNLDGSNKTSLKKEY